MATETIELQSTGLNDYEAISMANGNDLANITTEPGAPVQPETQLSKSRSIIIITQLSSIAFITSFVSGIITIGIPAIASSLNLHDNLLLWPYSVFYLTNASCLLLVGAIADVVGPRTMYLLGSFLLSVLIMACGLSRTGIELIMFRALQGIASAMIVPSSISIVSTSMESGTPRNLGFACIGLSMPMGFSFGLVLGGVFVDTIGWRAGFYLGAALTFVMAVGATWSLPTNPSRRSAVLGRLRTEVDWIGAMIASTALALLSYVLAILSADVNYIKHTTNISLLVISVAFFAFFPVWMQYQEKHGMPALIPNSVWKNIAFSSTCVMVLLGVAVQNSMEQFCSLFFQKVQEVSSLQASLRILPSLIIGIILNFATGLFVNRVPLLLTILVSTALCAGSPILMALINPEWPYWYDAFIAQLLAPLSSDILFTVGVLIVSDVFPARTQALAGAVFNTFAQIGASLGVSAMSVISVAVTKGSKYKNPGSPEAVLLGYRAAFWTQFGMTALSLVVAAIGLRKMGKVGVKRD